MRCLTVGTIKIFEVPSPAHSLMHQQLIIYLSFIFARKWKRFQWNFGQVDVFQRSNSKFKQIWDSCGDLVCQEVFEVFEGTSDSPKVMNIEWKVAFVPNNYLLQHSSVCILEGKTDFKTEFGYTYFYNRRLRSDLKNGKRSANNEMKNFKQWYFLTIY